MLPDRAPKLLGKTLLVLLLTVTGCETTSGPSSSKVRMSISAPEWEIEEQILAYTPLGMEDEIVLDFVNRRLSHSQEEDSEYDDIYVYVNEGGDSPYPEELNYKVIQVRMGLHGPAKEDFILKSNWVYISWLFENDQLIDIVVTKVVPGGEEEEITPTPGNYYEEVFHHEASDRF